MTHPAPPTALSPRPLLPVSFVLLAMILLPGMDAIAKGLTGLASISVISFVRGLTQMVMMAPGAWVSSQGRLWPLPHWPLHMLRGFCMVSAGMCFFAGVQILPLADNLALSFVYPLITVLVAPLWLNERLEARQILILALGFIGVLCIIRPGSGVFGAAALLPLASAFGYSAYVILTRRLAVAEVPMQVMQFWMAAFGSALTLPVMAAGMLLGINELSPWMIGTAPMTGMIAMGVIGTVGHMLITMGARHLSAGLVSGLGYAEIIPTTLIGWLFWHELPDLWSWIGFALVTASGMLLILLPARHRQAG
jgi:drug/metabolite transporter (DMT)-like permease